MTTVLKGCVKLDSEILLEAIRDLHKNETFERALGRVLRRHGRDYKDYLELMGRVRERATKEDVDMLAAAKREASE